MANANFTGCTRPYLEIIHTPASTPKAYDAPAPTSDALRHIAETEASHG